MKYIPINSLTLVIRNSLLLYLQFRKLFGKLILFLDVYINHGLIEKVITGKGKQYWFWKHTVYAFCVMASNLEEEEGLL